MSAWRKPLLTPCSRCRRRPELAQQQPWQSTRQRGGQQAGSLRLLELRYAKELTQFRLAAVHLLALLERNVVLNHIVNRRDAGNHEPVRQDTSAGRNLGQVWTSALLYCLPFVWTHTGRHYAVVSLIVQLSNKCTQTHMVSIQSSQAGIRNAISGTKSRHRVFH